MRLLASPTPKQQLQMKKVILYIFTIQWQIHKTNISIDQINQRPSWKNVHTVLGIRTWGRWMEGPDENHPSTRWKVCLFLSSTFVSNFGSLANVMTPDEKQWGRNEIFELHSQNRLAKTFYTCSLIKAAFTLQAILLWPATSSALRLVGNFST